MDQFASLPSASAEKEDEKLEEILRKEAEEKENKGRDSESGCMGGFGMSQRRRKGRRAVC